MYFMIYQSKNGHWRWRFIADNGKVIAVSSEGYVKKADCLQSIHMVRVCDDPEVDIRLGHRDRRVRGPK